jgi:hypothetical protein
VAACVADAACNKAWTAFQACRCPEAGTCDPLCEAQCANGFNGGGTKEIAIMQCGTLNPQCNTTCGIL